WVRREPYTPFALLTRSTDNPSFLEGTMMKHASPYATFLLTLAISSLLFFSAPTPSAPPKRLSSFDGQVQKLLSQMTLEEKIGQMTQVEQDALKDLSDIEKFSLGSLFSG